MNNHAHSDVFDLLKQSYDCEIECIFCGGVFRYGDTIGQIECSTHPGCVVEIEKFKKTGRVDIEVKKIVKRWECCGKPTDRGGCLKIDHIGTYRGFKHVVKVPSGLIKNGAIKQIPDDNVDREHVFGEEDDEEQLSKIEVNYCLYVKRSDYSGVDPEYVSRRRSFFSA